MVRCIKALVFFSVTFLIVFIPLSSNAVTNDHFEPFRSNVKSSVNNIVVFIRFQDDSENVYNTPLNIYNDIFNKQTDSVYNYFREVSYGKISVQSHFFPLQKSNSVTISVLVKHPRNYFEPKSDVNPIGYEKEQGEERQLEMIKTVLGVISDQVPDSVNLDCNKDGIIDSISIIFPGKSSQDPDSILYPHAYIPLPLEKSFNLTLKGKKLHHWIILPDSNALDYETVSNELCNELLIDRDLYNNLVITSIDTPNNAPTGGKFKVRDTVKNLGNAQADSFYVKYYLSPDSSITNSDTVIGSHRIDNLKPGASSSQTTTLTIPASYKAGKYYLGVYVDPGKNISETGENSNFKIYRTQIEITRATTDLVIRSFDGPKSGFTGGWISISTTVKNQGNARTSGFTVKYYLSTDSTITSEDYYIGSEYISSLDAQTSSAKSNSFKVPSDQKPGKYYLGAIVDPDNKVIETNEANNTIYDISQIEVKKATRDLVVIRIDGPSTGKTGGTIKVEAAVKNNGNIRTGGFILKYYLSTDSTITSSDNYIGSRWVSGLDAGTSNWKTDTLKIPIDLVPGVYYLGAYADPGNDVSETNEDNNTKYDLNQIEISRGTTDLVITDMTGPKSGLIGQAISVRARVKNQGNTRTGRFHVTVYLSTNPYVPSNINIIGNMYYVWGLDAWENSDRTNTFIIPSNLTPGKYYLGAYVDETNEVNETNENNNTKILADQIEITRAK